MSIPTTQPRELFTRLRTRGTTTRPGQVYTPEPDENMFFIGRSMVPRQFKPAIGGAASRDGHGWPYDGSMGTSMGHLPHLPYILVIPDRRSGLTTQGDTLRAASTQRIPPVLVRRAMR